MENSKEIQEWNDTIQQLWDAIGKPLDPRQFKIYQAQLKGVPQGLLEAVISKLLTGNTYHSIPTIGEVWQGVHAEIEGLGGPDMETNMDRWLLKYYVLRRVERYARINHEQDLKDYPAIKAKYIKSWGSVAQ